MSVAERTGITFPVDDVPPATEAVSGRQSPRPAREALLGVLQRDAGALETCWPEEGRLVPCGFHGLVAAAHLAFSTHAPLALSPDHVWLTIAQALALHLRQDPERWRAQLVAHAGRKTIEVDRATLGRRAPACDWAGVWGEFAGQLRQHSPTLVDLTAARFSTTGEAEGIAHAVAAMDALAPYFRYRVLTVCGIPSVTLEGTAADWEAVRARAERLAAFDLGWWLALLRPVLDQFVAAARGQADRAWWQRFYKQRDESGGPTIGGHICALFPYIVLTGDSQPRVARGRAAARTSDLLPGGLSRVPFAWEYLGTELTMEVAAGFVGVRQDPVRLTMRPEIGWAVCETG